MSVPMQVVHYLAELDAALKECHAPDRDQVLQQVAEHIDQALAELTEPSEQAIAAVLADVGDPLRIAQEAAAPAASAPASPPPAPPILARSWLPPLVLALFLIAETMSLAPLTHTVIPGREYGVLYGILTVFFFQLLYNWLWLASMVIVAISPLFRVGETVGWVLALPLVMAIVPPVIRDLFGSPYSKDALFGHLVAFGVAILAAALAMWLSIRAIRRARRWSAPVPATRAQQPAS